MNENLKKIEEDAENLLSEIVKLREGKCIKDETEFLTFAVVVCSNASNLENLIFSKLDTKDQVELIYDICDDLLQELISSTLISCDLSSELNRLISEEEEFKNKIKLGLQIYSLTSELVKLPNIKKIKLPKKVKKIKIPKLF